MALQVAYIYDYITKLFSEQQAEVMQSHENNNVGRIGKGETRHKKYKRLKLSGRLANDCSAE
jgi:hypothetical protein